ncbi:MAG: hypothetical protein QOK05_2786 [Chloroflexota bacterium]|jgi:hypothetical protein|nr:hypothetical protein [Chloroflexota bacterium]
MSDEMSFEELMSLEGRLRRAEAVGGEQESLGRALRKVQTHVNAAPAVRSQRWGRRLSMFAIVGIPAVAAAAIVGIVLLNANPQRAFVPTPATTPSPAPWASPSAVAANSCRLPVSGGNIGLNGPNIRGAFVEYPSGTTTVDPASEMIPATDGSGHWHMKNRPALVGDAAVPSYDLAMHQWLPVQFPAISPDGTKYAWVDYSALLNQGPGAPVKQPIHVTDVASGVDHVIHSGDQFDGPTWDAAGAIYVVHHLAGTDSGQGLWRMDPVSGLATQVDSSQREWQYVDQNSAWAAGPRIDQSQGKGPSDSVVHLDLSSGATATWFSRPGKWVQVIGVDGQGRALVTVTEPNTRAGNQLWAVSGPSNATHLDPAGGSPSIQYDAAWADRGITWLKAEDTALDGPKAPSLYRLAADGTLTAVPTWLLYDQVTGGCH